MLASVPCGRRDFSKLHAPVTLLLCWSFHQFIGDILEMWLCDILEMWRGWLLPFL
jgi:hypothetical protein